MALDYMNRKERLNFIIHMVIFVNSMYNDN